MPIQVLLVEDSAGDVRLTQEAFRSANRAIHVHVAADGVEAMAFLRQEGKYADARRPQLIHLDLNLPRKNGYEVIEEIKHDPVLRSIPVVIQTTSDHERDVRRSYDQSANSFFTKPVGILKSVTYFRNRFRSLAVAKVTMP